MPKRKPTRTPKGRFASKEESKAWAKEAKLQRFTKKRAKAIRREEQRREVADNRKRRKTRALGKRIVTRQTKARYQQEEIRFRLIQAGKTPKPDTFEANRIGRTDVYQWQGLDSEFQIRIFLRPVLESERPVPLTKLSVGTGYGRRADWIGSWWSTPTSTWRWLSTWQTRPSAQIILDADDAGQPIWWELEVKRSAKTRVEYANLRPVRRKRTKGEGKPKRGSVRPLRRKRKSTTKGKARSVLPKVRRKRRSRKH